MMKLKGLEFALSKKVGRAMADYQMLTEGDRIAVGVSGGKDSLSLLHVLRIRQAFSPIKYSLFVVHVDLGISSKNTKRLESYLKEFGCEYTIKKVSLKSGSKSRKRKAVSCFWCSWNRRKALFETAAKFKCNKIALGHHTDDIVQTILLNMFFNSHISAMSVKQDLFDAKLVLIRPLAYVQEREILQFARQQKLPFYTCKCIGEPDYNRKMIARMIKDLEKICPNVRTNIFRSIQRVRKDYLL